MKAELRNSAPVPKRSSSTATGMKQTTSLPPRAPSSHRKRTRRSERRSRRIEKPVETADQGCAAILWIVLLVGLIFCLVDVAYILAYVDTQQAEQLSPSGGSNDETSQQQPQQQQHPEATEPFDENVDYSIDKGPIIQILRDAGFHDIDNETMRHLPTWTEVTLLYGEKPRIYGLETCERFRTHSDPADHFVSAAGSFNSGTNLMSELLIHNCHNKARQEKYGWENRGVRWQVPWGKHNPPGDEAFRQSHKTLKDANVEATEILAAVTIRDPYVWMNSMCRHHYTANWAHDPDRHCPNLVPNQEDIAEFPRLRLKKNIPVSVSYADHTIQKNHDSLAHMWNDWYNEYKQVDFPRVIVRFEDLIFHAKEVTKTVCECAGGEMDRRFKYIVDSAKKGPNAHGPMHLRTGFVQAIVKYGKKKGRLDRYSFDDLTYAKQNLDRELMKFFGYLDPPVEIAR